MDGNKKHLVFGVCIAFVVLGAFAGVSVALTSAKTQSAVDNATAIGLGGQAESGESTSSDPLANTLFERKYKLALTLPPEKAVYLLPDMLSDAMPGGVIILNDTEVPETGESFEVCLLMFACIKNVTQYIAHEAVDPNVTAYAISVEEFIETVENVAETANEFIATGEIENLSSSPIQVPAGPGTGLTRGLLGYQEGLVQWFPELRYKYTPHEEMAGGVVPLWGAFTVVEKVKGVKMVVVKKEVPWYRAWYRDYRIGWWRYRYRVWHLKMVPAEFVKVISLHNVYDFEEGRPKMVKTVEKQIILEEELQDFWYFLPPPS